jgi:alpha-tubulin suppressor-like RCC1 family protein
MTRPPLLRPGFLVGIAFVASALFSHLNAAVIQWGFNGHGQLARNYTSYFNAPTQVDQGGALAGRTITAVAAGLNHTLALDSTGKVYAWGNNLHGQLGTGDTVPQIEAVAVSGGSLAGVTITAIAAGTDFSLCLDSTGVVHSWGNGGTGALGRGSYGSSLVPVALNNGPLVGKVVTKLAAGDSFAMSLTNDGVLYGWGANSSGQLGTGGTSSSAFPVAVSTTGVLSGKTISQIAAGSGFCVALDSAGVAYSWGHNGNGKLGDGTTTNRLSPVTVDASGVLAGKTLSQVSCGSAHAMVMTSTGLVYGWGFSMPLGAGLSSGNALTPVATVLSGALAGKTVTQIRCHHINTLLLTSSGQLFSTGSNNRGTLGTGSFNSSTTPASVSTSGVLAGKQVTVLSEGNVAGSAFCVTSDGVLASWGTNTHAQLGLGTTSPWVEPAVGSSVSGNQWLQAGSDRVAMGKNHMLALSDDLPSSILSAGHNNWGQLGRALTAIESGTYPLANLFNVTSIADLAAGEEHGAYVTSSGQLYVWGNNSSGQLGLGTSTTLYTSPVVVSTSSGVLNGKSISKVSCGSQHTLILSTDGQLFAAGNNSFGQLGNGTTTSSTSPVAVNMSGALAGKTVVTVVAGRLTSAAITSDGQLFLWGYGGTGQMGNGNTQLSNTSPLLLSLGHTAQQIAIGDSHIVALTTNGRVFAWGLNHLGQMGDGTTSTATNPVEITTKGALSGATVVKIAAGGHNSAFVTSQNRIMVCGAGGQGALGTGSFANTFLPTAIPNTGLLSNVVVQDISVGVDSMAIATLAGQPNIAVELLDGTPLPADQTHAFGSFATSGSGSKTIRIRNLGSGTLSGLNQSITLGQGFSYTGSLFGTSLLAGGYVDLPVNFTSPHSSVSGSASSQATLRIISNDQDTPQYDILLSAITLQRPAITSTVPNLRVNAGEPINIPVSMAGGVPITYRWLKEGQPIPISSGTVSSGLPGTAFNLTLPSVYAVQTGFYTLEYENAAYATASLRHHIAIGSYQFIQGDIFDSWVLSGGNASLSVDTGSAPGLTYQWYRSNGSAVSEGTTATLYLQNITAASAGDYYVVVSDGLVTEVSNMASARIGTLPSLSSWATSRRAVPGQPFTFTAPTASGTPTSFTYTWRKSGNPLPGAPHGSSYTIGNVSENDEGSYDVVVTNAVGSTISTATQVTVPEPILITQDPVAGGVVDGGSRQLSVAYTGDTTMGVSVKWYKDGVWVNSGSTITVYGYSSYVGQWWAVVSNDFSSATTASVQIGIIYAPEFVTQPPDTYIGVGGTATISFEVSGTGPYHYQWYKDNGLLVGVNTPTLSLANGNALTAGTYQVRVSNAAGAITSRLILVSVVDAIPVIIKQPAHKLVLQGQATELNVLAAGREPLRYQWYKNGKAIPGATAARHSLASVAYAAAGAYHVTVKAVSTTRSATAELGVVPSVGFDDFQRKDAEFGYYITAAGKGLSYEWEETVEGTPAYTGATNLWGSSLDGRTAFCTGNTVGYLSKIRCKVSGPGGNFLHTPYIRVFVVSHAPLLVAQTLPTAIQGSTYWYQTRTSSGYQRTAARYTATGLPPGLKMDATTGIIHGVCTTARVAPYQVVITVSNPLGKHTGTFPLNTLGFPSNLVGTYEALVPRSVLFNANRGGLLKLSITSKGSYTGTLMLGAFKHSLKGNFYLHDSAQDLAPSVALVGLPRGSVPVDVFLTISKSTGALSVILSNAGGELPLSAPQITWSKTHLATAYQGYFTAAARPDSPIPSQPQGWSYFSLSISDVGSTQITGRMADGSVVSYYGRVSHTGQVLYRQTFFSGVSTVQGSCAISSNGNMDGTWDWQKEPQTTSGRNYAQGFPPMLLNVVGGLYTPPPLGSNYLQAPLTTGNTPNAEFKPFHVPLVLRPGKAPIINRLQFPGTSLTVNSKLGTFLFHDSRGNTVQPSARGIAVERLGKAAGYGLLYQSALDETTGAQGPIYQVSEKVEIQATP